MLMCMEDIIQRTTYKRGSINYLKENKLLEPQIPNLVLGKPQLDKKANRYDSILCILTREENHGFSQSLVYEKEKFFKK